MKRSMTVFAPALIVAVSFTSAAFADPANLPAYRNASQGNLGGGFIELLMTGRSSGGRQQALRGAPAPVQAYLGNTGFILDDAPAPLAVPQRHVAPASLPRLSIEPGEDAAEPRGPRAEFQRQTVDYSGAHAPGTVIVDTPNKYLYLVQGGGKAIRYGIGVGRPGFEWAGIKSVTRKAEWPDWTPPVQMLKRRPDLPKFMAGGPENPLGARALYLGSSLYRIHGTNEPHTIGQAVSSGCIRMMNQDVTDLYSRVRVGTRVLVM